MEGTCTLCAFSIEDPKFVEYTLGVTPLMHATWKGYKQCVKELIAAGADVNQADNGGNTALMWAAVEGQTTCLLELIKSGANVNLMNNDGCMALMHAAKYGRDCCIREL